MNTVYVRVSEQFGSHTLAWYYDIHCTVPFAFQNVAMKNGVALIHADVCSYAYAVCGYKRYDSAMVAVRNGEAIHNAMGCAAPYTQGPPPSAAAGGGGGGAKLSARSAPTSRRLRPVVPGLQNSKRARGVVAWAALQQLGVDGVAGLVDGCCSHAARFATLLCESSRCTAVLLHPVIFNQALVSFGSNARTAAVAAAVQKDGRCWAAAATYHGQTVMRISVSCWMTTKEDIEASAAAIVEVASQIEINM